MSEFTAKKLKEARMKAGFTQDEAADLMKTTKRAISQIEADKRALSADELAQFSRIYNVDVRELLFVEFTEAGDEQRLTAKYSSFLKLLEKLSDREVEDVYWVIKRKVCFLQALFAERGVRTKSWTKMRSITGGGHAHVFLRRTA